MPELTKVFPNPELKEHHEYLPGVPDDGGEVPASEAKRLKDRDLVLLSEPKSDKKSPAAPDKKE